VTTERRPGPRPGRTIDLAYEQALLARRQALEGFQLEALALEAARRGARDAADVVAAEAKVEAAREAFWAADRALREIRRSTRTG
jgi:hypothetical protein